MGCARKCEIKGRSFVRLSFGPNGDGILCGTGHRNEEVHHRGQEAHNHDHGTGRPDGVQDSHRSGSRDEDYYCLQQQLSGKPIMNSQEPGKSRAFFRARQTTDVQPQDFRPVGGCRTEACHGARPMGPFVTPP